MCYDSKPTALESHRDGASSRGGFSYSPYLEARIAAFLDGRTCGEELLHALYDHVLDEPIPPSMRALLNK
jgi:hypothetical protein